MMNVKTSLVKLLFIGLILSFSTLSAQNTVVDSLVVNGNKAFLNKDYDTAITDYQKIVDQGYESAALYYNLGNAYFRKGILGEAILNYEKGLKLDPTNEDLLYNLKIANAHIVDKIDKVPEFFLLRWWKTFVSIFSLHLLDLILALLFVLFLIAVWFFIFGRTSASKKGGLFAGTSLLILLVLAIFLYIGKVDEINSSHYAIVLAKEVTAMTSPDESSKAIFILHEGTKVSVEDGVGEWEQVRLTDGKKGWVRKNSLGFIK
jgi:tetratricopeptide (TPR) repeat protein